MPCGTKESAAQGVRDSPPWKRCQGGECSEICPKCGGGKEGKRLQKTVVQGSGGRTVEGQNTERQNKSL